MILLKDYIIESINKGPKEDDRIDMSNAYDKLKFEKITSLNELTTIISNANVSKKTGFWLFKEALEKDDAYGKINKSPWFIQYIKVIYDNVVVGLISYSLEYEEENYYPSIHTFDIQTRPGYKGLLEAYFDFIEKEGKKNKKKYATLKCYEPNLADVYKRYSYKKSEKEYNTMYKKV